MHELEEYLVVFLCLAPFFLSFAVYRVYLLDESGKNLFTFTAALVKALILAKIVLLGEIVGLGRRLERHPLIVPTLYKALVFTVFYLALHVLEHIADALLHGQTPVRSLAEVFLWKGELSGLAFVMFFAFIPFFALREMRRVIGAVQFRDFFVGRRPPGQFRNAPMLPVESQALPKHLPSDAG